MSILQRRVFIPWHLLLIGAGVAALLTGSMVSWAVIGRDEKLPPPLANGDSPLASVSPNDSNPSASRSVGGAVVEFQGTQQLDAGRTLVYYKVHSESTDSFADMLGTPRVINPDGTIVIPQASGLVGSNTDTIAGVPGLPAGSSGAVYKSADIQPGAIIRFGPFFRAGPADWDVHATGQQLLDGVTTTIGGEQFRISAEATAGMTMVTLVNVTPDASVMATNPASRETVTVDGKAANVVHGSANFAKDGSGNVNANQSAIVVQADLAPDSEVVISGSSIGTVVRGNWDFPLK